jgi:Domain of unknown function (DUF6378)
MNILEEADHITSKDRQKDYGHPLDNHTQTAEMVTAFLKRKLKEPLTAEDVCMIQILLKISRYSHAPKRDTLIDIPGYARNIEMIQEERRRRSYPHPELLDPLTPLSEGVL